MMHDCREVENKFMDLIFDEVDPSTRRTLLAQIETCAGCAGEYRSMQGTLQIFDEALDASLPGPQYLATHVAGVRRRLPTPRVESPARQDSFWRSILTTRLSIPVPVAAVITIGLILSAVLALRSSENATGTLRFEASVSAPITPQIIEVPVTTEKVVTRTVYVERPATKRATNLDRLASAERNNPVVDRLQTEAATQNLFTSAALRNFQPPDELRIRLIKRSNADEN